MHPVLQEKILYVYSNNKPAKEVKKMNTLLHNIDSNFIYVFRYCYTCKVKYELKDNENLCNYCEKIRREKEAKELSKDLINLHIED